MKQRIYIDTSVIGGYYDAEFESATQQLFSRIVANVNYDKIKMFNAINMRFGYPLIDIRSPLEFLKI
jgi:hypothetical protein